MYVCRHVCIHTYMPACMHADVHKRMHKREHVYTYIHTYIGFNVTSKTLKRPWKMKLTRLGGTDMQFSRQLRIHLLKQVACVCMYVCMYICIVDSAGTGMQFSRQPRIHLWRQGIHRLYMCVYVCMRVFMHCFRWAIRRDGYAVFPATKDPERMHHHC